MLDNNVILNFLHTEEDNKISENIYGKDVHTMRGRKIRSGLNLILSIPEEQLPYSLRDTRKNARLFIDILFINNIPFLY